MLRPGEGDVTATEKATISISCDDCDLQRTDACGDCLVSFILGREADDALVVDVAEARAIRMLGRAGLVPELRHPAAAVVWAAC